MESILEMIVDYVVAYVLLITIWIQSVRVDFDHPIIVTDGGLQN